MKTKRHHFTYQKWYEWIKSYFCLVFVFYNKVNNELSEMGTKTKQRRYANQSYHSTYQKWYSDGIVL